jgi:hypothetical protein
VNVEGSWEKRRRKAKGKREEGKYNVLGAIFSNSLKVKNSPWTSGKAHSEGSAYLPPHGTAPRL